MRLRSLCFCVLVECHVGAFHQETDLGPASSRNEHASRMTIDCHTERIPWPDQRPSPIRASVAHRQRRGGRTYPQPPDVQKTLSAKRGGVSAECNMRTSVWRWFPQGPWFVNYLPKRADIPGLEARHIQGTRREQHTSKDTTGHQPVSVHRGAKDSAEQPIASGCELGAERSSSVIATCCLTHTRSGKGAYCQIGGVIPI